MCVCVWGGGHADTRDLFLSKPFYLRRTVAPRIRRLHPQVSLTGMFIHNTNTQIHLQVSYIYRFSDSEIIIHRKKTGSRYVMIWCYMLYAAPEFDHIQ